MEDQLGHSRRQQLRVLWFIVPLIIGVALVYFAAAEGLALGFANWNIISLPKWAGLSNFQELLHDPKFGAALRNTFIIVGVTVPAKMIVGLGLALLLQRPLRAIGFFRLSVFFPATVSVVSSALVWSYLYSPQGLFNDILHHLGVGPVYWLSANNALLSLSGLIVWEGSGYVALLFLAGLASIPNQYYEAARVDGAGRTQRLLHVTLPLLTPTTFFVIVISLIAAFQTFGEVFVIQGPLNSTLTIVQYIYQTAFNNFAMGYAAAMSYVLIAIIFGITFLQLRLQRRWVHYDS